MPVARRGKVVDLPGLPASEPAPEGFRIDGRARHGRDTKVRDALRMGCSREKAAAAAGMTHLLFERWMADPTWALMVEQAEQQFQIEMLAAVVDPDNRNWQQNAWMLERRWPETYAKRNEVSRTERIKVSNQIGTELATAVLAVLDDSGLSPDQQQQVRARLADAVERVAVKAS